MLPAPIAARELERLRAQRSAESARQLPLHAENPSLLAPGADDGDRDGGSEADSPLPDWAMNY